MVGLKLGRLGFFMFLLFSLSANANDPVLFEGYYRVLKGGQHVGYYIMKHEFDAKKKQFIASTFMRLEGADDSTESIRAIATEDFRPISFSYTAAQGGMTRTIDIRADKTKMTGTITHLGKQEKIAKPLGKNAISSLFLIYAILRSPQGLKPNSTFNYEAVAEELAEVHPGNVQVGASEDVGGVKAMRIENTFLETKSTNLVTDRGEVLATISPTQKIAIELVAKPENAYGNFRLQNSLLKAHFGKVPDGLTNVYSKAGRVDPPLPGKAGSMTAPAVGGNQAPPSSAAPGTGSAPMGAGTGKAGQ